MKNLAEINEVIKASPAIQIQSKISLLQRRAWNVLLANAYNQLPNKEIHSISVGELAAKLGFKDIYSNQHYLKEVLKSIVDCKVEWNVLGKDKKEDWGVASLLAEVRIRDGICFYQFPHTLRLKLHNPRIYAKLNLRLQNRFKSRYALVLWEVCFDYFDTNRDRGETPFIPLKVFKGLMGLEKDEYAVFKELNRHVIKPAVKELNDLTDYHVEVEQKRIGRPVAELKFQISKVKQIPIQESLFPDIENLPPVAIELVQSDVDRDIATKIANAEWDFVLPEKLPTPGDYSDFLAYVSEKIEMSMYASNVNNTGGYVVEAIRNNYQNSEVRKERGERAERAREKELEDLTEAYNVKRVNALRQIVQADPELVERAVARIDIPFIRRRIEEDCDTGMQAYQEFPGVKAHADHIIAEELCPEKFASMAAAYEDEKARILGNIG